MKVGFTGSRFGMDSRQIHNLMSYLRANDVEEFHHGSCVGADTEAHHCAIECGIHVIIHPPTNREFMSDLTNCDPKEVRKAFGYLERNRHIVDETDVLLSAPKSGKLNKGTFWTTKYAQRTGKSVIILSSLKKVFDEHYE